MLKYARSQNHTNHLTLEKRPHHSRCTTSPIPSQLTRAWGKNQLWDTHIPAAKAKGTSAARETLKLATPAIPHDSIVKPTFNAGENST